MITFKEYCKILKEDWGKTSPIPKEVYGSPDPIEGTGAGWVDLGLPSGTLWAETNVKNPLDNNPYWTWDDIMSSAYKNHVPTKEQLLELKDGHYCKWSWDNERAGYEVVSKKNGNSIFLPAGGWLESAVAGERSYGFYWSSTVLHKNAAHCLRFDRRHIELKNNFSHLGVSVRLVKNKD